MWGRKEGSVPEISLRNCLGPVLALAYLAQAINIFLRPPWNNWNSLSTKLAPEYLSFTALVLTAHYLH